jgi:hypothetical protein
LPSGGPFFAAPGIRPDCLAKNLPAHRQPFGLLHELGIAQVEVGDHQRKAAGIFGEFTVLPGDSNGLNLPTKSLPSLTLYGHYVAN